MMLNNGQKSAFVEYYDVTVTLTFFWVQADSYIWRNSRRSWDIAFLRAEHNNPENVTFLTCTMIYCKYIVIIVHHHIIVFETIQKPQLSTSCTFALIYESLNGSHSAQCCFDNTQTTFVTQIKEALYRLWFNSEVQNKKHLSHQSDLLCTNQCRIDIHKNRGCKL